MYLEESGTVLNTCGRGCEEAGARGLKFRVG